MIFHVAMHRHRGESVPLELALSFGDKVQPLLHDNYTNFLQSKSSITALQVKATLARKPHKNTTLVTSFCVWKFLIFVSGLLQLVNWYPFCLFPPFKL